MARFGQDMLNGSGAALGIGDVELGGVDALGLEFGESFGVASGGPDGVALLVEGESYGAANAAGAAGDKNYRISDVLEHRR